MDFQTAKQIVPSEKLEAPPGNVRVIGMQGLHHSPYGASLYGKKGVAC